MRDRVEENPSGIRNSRARERKEKDERKWEKEGERHRFSSAS